MGNYAPGLAWDTSDVELFIKYLFIYVFIYLLFPML